jgi:nitronate monooxygenase
MLATRFTELVGCTVPIQLAGMGAVATPELAAAVSNAGGLGMLGTGRPGLSISTLDGLLCRMRDLTSRPFGVNFLVEPGNEIDRKCFEMAAKAARVVEFFYGDPDPELVKIVHDHGSLACWQIGSSNEAVAAAEARCDLIVAQGIEAGGHVRGRIGLQALLSEVNEVISLPVIAAGGIGTGRGMAAALVAGVDGVRIGTRFVAALETGAHPTYVAALIAASAEDTVYTEAFSRGWAAPHRVLRSCIAAAEALEDDIIGERESLDGTRVPAFHLQPLAVDRTTTGALEAMPLWAGEGVGAIKRIQSVRDIMDELTTEAENILRRRRFQ